MIYPNINFVSTFEQINLTIIQFGNSTCKLV
jgi:hypothetical protein